MANAQAIPTTSRKALWPNLWAFAGIILVAMAVAQSLGSSWLRHGVWASRQILILFVALNIFAGGVYLLAVWQIHRRTISRAAFLWIIVVGAAMRLVLVPSTIVWETDSYRYLWDGGLVAHGINPYSQSPQEVKEARDGKRTLDPGIVRLAREAGDTLKWINHPRVTTIYPPGAQATFAIAHWLSPWSVTAWRIVLLGFDAATLVLLVMLLRALSLPIAAVAIYWWNPLLVKSFYGEAHLDVIVMPFVVGALLAAIRGRKVMSAASLALGVGGKLWPVVLLPLVLRAQPARRRALAALAVFICLASAILLPMFVGHGGNAPSGTAAYARAWENNDGLYRLQVWLWQQSWLAGYAHLAARVMTVAAMLLWLAWLARKPLSGAIELSNAFMLAVAGLFLLSPTEFPWYYAWLVPLLAIHPVFPLLLYTVLMPLYHLHYAEPAWVWAEHLPVWGLLITAFVYHRLRLRHTLTVAMPCSIDAVPANTATDPIPSGVRVAVIIPALNEETAIGSVLDAIPRWVDDVLVVDNGSTDRTAAVARAHGARVIREPRRGYGQACLTGIAALDNPDIVVFLDGDFSDRPNELPRLVQPIVEGKADLVIGSRTLGQRERGSLTVQQRFGNALACFLLAILYHARHTDLGPFRAIRLSSLKRFGMDDAGYGWTIQMQVRAAQCGLRVCEVPVNYHRRIGQSKISGTLRGVVGAGSKILYTIFRESLQPARTPHEQLAVFVRFPQPGQAKTRLIPALGPEGAAELQHKMTLHTLRSARDLRRLRRTEVTVRYSGGDEQAMRSLYGADLGLAPQGEGDLGQRLRRITDEAFANGTDALVIIGSDCPELTPAIMQEAFDALRRHDVVLGPASDGGYYLIGLRRPAPELFDGIAWGTNAVLTQTLQAASRLGLSTATLGVLNDVDLPADLPVWHRALDANRANRISVIIPTLNEEQSIESAIRSAITDDNVEVIVVDGGSTDTTVDIARGLGASMYMSEPSRAAQMNTGAAHATGDILLFLHADTRLPAGFGDHVHRLLHNPDTSAGAFALAIEPATLSLRAISAAANFRSRHSQMPYGDQAIFLRRDTFHRLGSFRPILIMEDIDLVNRLRRLGRIRIAGAAVRTSGRRWLRDGVWRTTLLHQFLLIAYRLGVSPSQLHQWREQGISRCLRNVSRMQLRPAIDPIKSSTELPRPTAVRAILVRGGTSLDLPYSDSRPKNVHQPVH